jgi:hypothetical protein
MKLLAFLIPVFAFEQLSKNLKYAIAENLEPFSAVRMMSLSRNMSKIKVYEHVIVDRQTKEGRKLFPFEVFRIAATGKYCITDKNGRLDENIDLHRVVFGQTFVYVAAEYGQTEVVKALAQHGVDVNKATNDTPIHVAACGGHIKVVKVLVELGADPMKVNQYGSTPVDYAADIGHTKIVKFLAELGADLKEAIFIAAREGHKEVVKALADYGVDVNESNTSEYTPIYAAAAYDTPIYFAAAYGRTEAVRALIQLKATLNENLLEIASTKTIKHMILNAILNELFPRKIQNELFRAAAYDNTVFVKALEEQGVDRNKAAKLNEYLLEKARTRKFNQKVENELLPKIQKRKRSNDSNNQE